MKNKFGFTLAETLITLGIIGIVAATTLPVLIYNFKKHSIVNKLKKSYSTVYNAIEMARSENGDIVNWDINFQPNVVEAENYSKYYSDYAKQLAELITLHLNVVEKKFDVTYRDYGYTKGILSRTGTYRGAGNSYPVYLKLSDGTILFIAVVNNNALPFIGIDINGLKGPNRAGTDIFYFYIDKSNGKLNAYSAADKEETCSVGCAYFIIKNNWKINYKIIF